MENALISSNNRGRSWGFLDHS